LPGLCHLCAASRLARATLYAARTTPVRTTLPPAPFRLPCLPRSRSLTRLHTAAPGVPVAAIICLFCSICRLPARCLRAARKRRARHYLPPTPHRSAAQRGMRTFLHATWRRYSTHATTWLYAARHARTAALRHRLRPRTVFVTCSIHTILYSLFSRFYEWTVEERLPF